MAPYCDRCVAFNDGCVAAPPDEVGCGFGEASTGPVATTTTAEESEGSTAGSSSGDGEVLDSSSTGMPNLCGNGMLDEGEVCDGDMFPEDASCIAGGFGDGTIGCVPDCSTIDYTGCSEYMDCGNGEVANGEQCDGSVFAGSMQSCDDFPNLTGDGLACTDECMYDTSACMVCREHGQPCDRGKDVCCDEGDICGNTLSGPHCCAQGTGDCLL